MSEPLKNEVKPAMESKTIIGAIIAIIGGLAPLLGYALSEADIDAIQRMLESGAVLVTSTVTIVGGAMAIWGRVKAKKSISGVVHSPSNYAPYE